MAKLTLRRVLTQKPANPDAAPQAPKILRLGDLREGDEFTSVGSKGVWVYEGHIFAGFCRVRMQATGRMAMMGAREEVIFLRHKPEWPYFSVVE